MRSRASIILRIVALIIATVLLSCGHASLPFDVWPTKTPPPKAPSARAPTTVSLLPSATLQPTPTPTATPPPLAQWLQDAEVLRRQSRFQEAEEAYWRILDAAPRYAPAYVALSRLYGGWLGRDQESLKHALRAADLAPADPLAHAALALAYVDALQIDLALGEAQHAANLGSSNAQVQAALVEVYLESRDDERALEAAERAVSLAPQMGDAYAALGDVYLARGDLARARAALERAIVLEPAFAPWHIHLARAWQALARPSLADDALQAALKLAPDHGEALIALARLRIDQSQFGDAASLIDRVIALASSSSAPYVARSYLHLAQDEPDQAIADLRRALELNEKDPQAQGGLVNVYIEQKECDGAAREAQVLDQWYPHTAAGLLGQGRAKLCAGDSAKALDYFRRALKREPYNASAHLFLSQTYAAQERWEDALASAAQALWLQPGYTQVHLALAAAFGEQGQFSAQQSELEAALRLDPGLIEAYIDLAGLSLLQGEPDAAEAQASQALQRRPTNARGRRLVGMALYEQGKTVEATAALKQLVADEPEDALAHYYLGLAYRDAGRYIDAAQELRIQKGLSGTAAVDELIGWLEQGYVVAEKQFLQAFEQALQDYLDRPVRLRVESPPMGARTLVIILQPTGKETEEELFPDVVDALLGMSALAPRLDPPVTGGITVLVQREGRTLYTAHLTLDDARAIGDGRRPSEALGNLARFTRPLGAQSAAVWRKVRVDMERTREIKSTRYVPFTNIDAPALGASLHGQWARAESPRSLREDQVLLTLLGIIEPQTDLGRIYADLHADQAAGYYDPDKAAMFVLKQPEQSAQDQMTVAHEYSHALQDQYLRQNPQGRPPMNADERLAFRALVEGDATLATAIYASQHIPAVDVWTSVARVNGLEPGPEGKTLPMLQEMALFPYASGLDFVAALHQQGGWELVNQAYAAPPRSTEQVLHPVSYHEGDLPKQVELPDVAAALGSSWKLMDVDVLGEFGLRLVLADYVGMGVAIRAAEGWGADQYALLERGNGEAHALVIRTTWDNQDEVQEFWRLFQTAMRHRPEYTEQVDSLTGPTEVHRWVADGSHVVAKWLHGQVMLIYAEDEPTATTILGAFGG